MKLKKFMQKNRLWLFPALGVPSDRNSLYGLDFHPGSAGGRQSCPGRKSRPFPDLCDGRAVFSEL